VPTLFLGEVARQCWCWVARGAQGIEQPGA